MTDRKQSTLSGEADPPISTQESHAPEVEMSEDIPRSQDYGSTQSRGEADFYAKLTDSSTMRVNGCAHEMGQTSVTIPAGHPCQIDEEFDRVPANDDALARHRLAALVNLNMTRDEYDSRTGPLTARDIGVALGDGDFTVEWAMNYLLGLGYRDFSVEGLRACLRNDNSMVAVRGRYRTPSQGYVGTAGEKGIYEGLRNGRAVELLTRDPAWGMRHRTRNDGMDDG